MIDLLDAKFKNWLLSVIGKKLYSVIALIYVYEGEEDLSSPQEIILRFESAICGKLTCCSDGASICWNEEEIVESDLGEYGTQIIKEMSSIPIWQRIAGYILKNINLIISLRESCLMGLKFTFENNLSLILVNLGDEFFVFESLPVEVIEGQEVEFIPVT